MKRIIISNVVAALGVLALLLLVDAIHVLVHPLSRYWWSWVFLALPCAFFCVANRGLLRGKTPLVRCTGIALLSALLAVVSFCLSFFLVLYSHHAIESGPSRVSGRVTGRSGNSIANARLVILELSSEEQHPHEAETRSDADGRFILRTVRGANQLSVQADNYASMSFVRTANLGWSRNWNFELPRTLPISGRVLDTTGKPVPDRVVEFDPMIPRGVPASHARFQWGRSSPPTDRDGRFTIAAAPSCVHKISVRSGDTGMMQYPVNIRYIEMGASNRVEPLDIVLHPAGEYMIAGHVRGSAGHPIPQVFVDTYIPSGPHWSTRTDEKGAFCIQGLDGVGTSSFKVNFQGAYQGKQFELAIHGVPMNSTNVNLVVPGRGGVHGTVRNAKTGQMVTNYEASVYRMFFPDSGAVWEQPWTRVGHSPDGRFIMSNLLAGEVTVEIRAEGLGSQRFEIPVLAGANHPMTFDMLGPAVLDIETTMNGTPTSVTTVIAGKTAPLGKDGHARYDTYPNGRHQVWFFGSDGGSHQRATEVELRSGETTRLAMEMGGSCEVSGSVFYPDKYFCCMVRLASKPAPDGWSSSRPTSPGEGVLCYAYVMRNGGEYRLRNIPPGRWHLMVGMDHRYIHRYTPAWTQVIELKDGERLKRDFDLTKMDEQKSEP